MTNNRIFRFLCVGAAALLLLPLASCGGQTEESAATASAPEQSPTELPTELPTEAPTEPPTEASTETPDVPEPLTDYRIGTINAADGKANTSNKTRFYNEAYNRLADVTGVTVGSGYELTWLAYDGAKKYVGNGNDNSGYWQGDGVYFTSGEILRIYPQAVYFRFAVRKMGGSTITMTDVEKSAVTIVPAGTAIDAAAAAHTFSYAGSFSADKKITLTPLENIGGGQDGAAYGGFLFRFNSKGQGTVTRLSDGAETGTVTLEGTAQICPHGNSVTFGAEKYDASDEFPLLYSNVYNTYASAADRREGVCCVYRLVRSGENFTGKLVQVLRVGFAREKGLWLSETGTDVRPYGNFAVDAEQGKLWVFVMRDAPKQTRFFGFDLPPVTAGETGEFGSAKVVTLRAEDIKSQFDTDYVHYMQGACARNGILYSVEGFTNAKSSAAPALRVIDLAAGKQVAFADLYAAGYLIEPELITFDGSRLLYSDNKGKLFEISFGGSPDAGSR